MPVLAMLELDGDTDKLLAATAELERLDGIPDGVLVRIVAPLESGMVLFQLWESAAARQRNAENPEHARALEESGIRAAMTGSRSRAFEDATLLVP